MLLGSASAEAGKSGSTRCATKAAQGKARKSKKRKSKRGCKPAAPGGGTPTVSAPPATSPDGASTSPPPSTDSATGCVSGMPKDGGGSWQSTFVDDFSGSSLDGSKWIAQRTDGRGFGDGTSSFVDNPNNVSVSDGTLKLTSRKVASPFTCNSPLGNFDTQYTSGMVSTWGRFSQAYGRFEVRAKISPAQVKGLQSSLWLWPADDTHYGPRPASGEIDIAEMFSSYPDRAVPYIHYVPAGSDPNVTNTNCLVSNLSAFHDFAVEWTPSSIKIIYDGHTCLVDVWNAAAPLTGRQPFDQPFFVALTQGLGAGDNGFDSATTPLAGATEVDWVRVWK